MSERTAHGFRTGAIEAAVMAEFDRGTSIQVWVGTAIITIQATPKGRKVWVNIVDSPRNAVAVSARIGGRWTTLEAAKENPAVEAAGAAGPV